MISRKHEKTLNRVALTLAATAMAVASCQCGDLSNELVGKQIPFGAANAEQAGAILEALPPITVDGAVFSNGVTGEVTVEFPSPSTFSLAGGGVPADRESGDLGFGSCIFTWEDATTLVVSPCGVEIVEAGVCRVVFGTVKSSTFDCTIEQTAEGTYSVNGLDSGIATDEITGATGASN